MKQLVTAIASLMLILSLIVEFTEIQIFYISIMKADYEISALHDVIRNEGCVSEYTEDKIKNSLSSILGCEYEDIEITGPNKKAKKGEIIDFGVNAVLINKEKSWLFGSPKDYVYKFNRQYAVISSV